MAAKLRADQLAADLGLVESREQAKRLIMAGQMLMETAAGLVPVDKPGRQLAADTRLELKAQERFVSRGAYKLETALDHFAIAVEGLTVLDAGASTGGFTDCLLQRGASRIYAVDVGTHQLHEKLRADARVVSMEGVNLRHAGPDLLPEPVDMITADVSFISLTKVLPASMQFLKPGGRVVVLIKPQFELEPHEIGKGGVVREEALRDKAVAKVVDFCTGELGLVHHGTVPSKITGPKGNQEYLALFHLPADKAQ